MKSVAKSAVKRPKPYTRVHAETIIPGVVRTFPKLTNRDRELIEEFIAQLMAEAQNGLTAAQAMYEASGRDPALLPQIEHFRTYLKCFRWATIRATHRQAFLALRILSGNPYPEA